MLKLYVNDAVFTSTKKKINAKNSSLLLLKRNISSSIFGKFNPNNAKIIIINKDTKHKVTGYVTDFHFLNIKEYEKISTFKSVKELKEYFKSYDYDLNDTGIFIEVI